MLLTRSVCKLSCSAWLTIRTSSMTEVSIFFHPGDKPLWPGKRQHDMNVLFVSYQKVVFRLFQFMFCFLKTLASMIGSFHNSPCHKCSKWQKDERSPALNRMAERSDVGGQHLFIKFNLARYCDSPSWAKYLDECTNNHRRPPLVNKIYKFCNM